MSDTREAYKQTGIRRNQVNLQLTDEEMQILMKGSMETGLRVGILARTILREGIEKYRKGAQIL